MLSRFSGPAEVNRGRPTGVAAAIGVTIALVFLLVIALGITNPVRTRLVTSDALGPDNGELVSDYLVRASRSLEQPLGNEHWALVSFTLPVSSETVLEVAAAVRVSQLLFRLPLDRVQTPLVPVSVASGDAAIERAHVLASGRVQRMTGETVRQGEIAEVSSEKFAQNCACVIAIVVRGDLDRLRELQSASAVRAVEALHTDAVFGRFAIRPLLPEQGETVTPGPDDGAVSGGGS
ncbi:hypothetical protein [Rhodococcus tibetensis]|uniref:DUF4230 domain-containing protein n=1 Tax=Rhodococcus tibetensis TaxID=2965064 RepID=A0ABT1QD36_9NOCA|nr:hypothetical protein [Rhodococcus sp. FXJ9.536]MCQ4119067.1 hypothetical protein [Rhodococcus sp. FXJ9.536]